MKKAKRLVSLLLALVMLLSLTVSAAAALEPSEYVAPDLDTYGMIGNLGDGEIRITDAIPKEEYYAYQILYLESYSEDDNAYVYKVNPNWSVFVENASIKSVYLNVDANNGYVTWVDGADPAEFAKLALEYAQTDKSGNNKKPGEDGYVPTIAPVQTKEAGTASAGSTVTTVTFTDLKLGYYLVDTSLGALCSLDTTDSKVNIQEKNEVPTNYKQVKEDIGDDNWKGSEDGTIGENDADIGQTVEFRSTIRVYPGTDNLIFHDQMESGLTFTKDNADAITVNLSNIGGSLNKNLEKGKDFFVEFNPNGTVPHTSADIEEECTFHVRFSDEIFETLQAGGNNILIINYKATLNENAIIGTIGNANVSRVSYGDKYHATPESKTITRTYKFDIFKYDKSTNEPLSDTKFELHSNDGFGHAGDVIYLVKKETVEGQPDAYRVAKKDDTQASGHEAGALTEITTNATGKFSIEGLDAATYYLVETQPQSGYSILTKPVEISIEYKNGNVVIKKDQSEIVGAEIGIENGSGGRLPQTGGIGTTIFYVAGSILLIGAAVLLIVKKRMSNEK